MRPSDREGFNVFIVPHLPVANNLRGILAGLDDQSIESSEECLAALREAIEPYRFAAVLSSPLRRSLETVALCFDTGRVPLRVDPRLLPIDYGRFHGRTKRDVAPLSHTYVGRPFPGGESFRQVAARHQSFLLEVLPEYAGRDVVLIGHEGSDSILAHLCEGGTLKSRLLEANEQSRQRIAAGVGLLGFLRRPPAGPFFFARARRDR